MNKLDALFEVPTDVARPLRILVFALSKRGKSHFVSTAAEVGPLYWFDTERGSDFYDPSRGHGFKPRYDKDPNMVIEAIKLAHQVALKGDVVPVVAIDSMSSVWFEQQEVAERISRGGRQQKDSDRASFRSWAAAKKPLKRLYELLHYTTCHVVITARQKDEYSVDRKGEPVLTGVKADVERNLDYCMDFIVQMGMDDLELGVAPKPENFWARVVGTRMPPGENQISIGTVFKDPKLSDFLVGVKKGEAPTEVEGSALDQAERELNAPQNWGDLSRRAMKLNPRWSPDDVKQIVKEKFGKYDSLMLVEYWEYLQEQAKDES